MTKQELLERLDRRARRRYGVDFTKIFLDDLIKDKLVQRSKRLANKGRRPTHYWGSRAYRRGLQLARLKANGIDNRNSQRVFLFLNGYSYPVSLVREPLRVEYVSQGKTLLSAIRSRFIHNKKTIPPGQKERLVRSFGHPDPTFIKAAIELGPDILISAVRSASQDALRQISRQNTFQKRTLDVESMMMLASKLLSGMLLFDGDSNNFEEELDNIEGLILKAPESSYDEALKMLRTIDFNHPLIMAILFPKSSDVDFRIAASKSKLAIKYDPLFATTAFVILLRVAVQRDQ